MKFLSSLLASPNARGEPEALDERLKWVRDPLSHPALEAMSERELADLPFNRGYRAQPQAGCCSRS